MSSSTINNITNPKAAFSRASLVCSIISILGLCCYYISPISGALAIIFAFMGRRNGQFDAVGLSGLILGIIGFVGGCFMFMYALYVIAHPEIYEEAVKMLESMGYEFETTTDTINIFLHKNTPAA